MRLFTGSGLVLGAGVMLCAGAGCAGKTEPSDLKRERDRLSYQVTELQAKLAEANTEIDRLRAANGSK